MTQTQIGSFQQCSSRLLSMIEKGLRSATQLAGNSPDDLRSAIGYSLLAPGKRLRAMLVLMAAEACEGTADSAMPAACAVEMVHAYSLIHDDLPAMDDDDLRRGLPTCHKKFDEATAILAGDALLTMAFEILADQVQPASKAAACCAALAKAAGPSGMVGGQADDIAGIAAGTSLERLEAIHRCKTGAMIEVSLRLGAMVADADANQMTALATYGRCLGLAFQVTDDLLDVRSSEEAMGKRVGKDAHQGKLTFPVLLGIDASIEKAAKLIDQATEALEPFGSRADDLTSLARFVLERNR